MTAPDTMIEAADYPLVQDASFGYAHDVVPFASLPELAYCESCRRDLPAESVYRVSAAECGVDTTQCRECEARLLGERGVSNWAGEPLTAIAQREIGL